MGDAVARRTQTNAKFALGQIRCSGLVRDVAWPLAGQGIVVAAVNVMPFEQGVGEPLTTRLAAAPLALGAVDGHVGLPSTSRGGGSCHPCGCRRGHPCPDQMAGPDSASTTSDLLAQDSCTIAYRAAHASTFSGLDSAGWMRGIKYRPRSFDLSTVVTRNADS